MNKIKNFARLFFFLLFISQLTDFIYSQSAQSYFPSQIGFKWTFKAAPLDSSNNPITLLSYYQIDSFAVVSNYNGRTANYIVSKSGSELTVPFTPYYDTTNISFTGNDGYKYFRLFNLDSLLAGFGNRSKEGYKVSSTESTEAFEGWFPYYKFAQSVNTNYAVFSKDTSVVIDSTTFPIRIELNGKRLADETITTELGNFTCKKFSLTTTISYLLLPFFPIQLFELLDTTWIASENWIVKQVLPSTAIDLTSLGFGSYFLPGSMREIVPPLVTNIQDENFGAQDFYLYQNYPNPFNPSTKISWQSPVSGWQIIKVFDVLGNEVAALIDEYKPAGTYEVELSANGLASGIYYYQLKAGDFVRSKKMIYLK